MVVEGARVGRGAVLGAGTILNPSIPVIDAETGEELSRGHVPDWSVAVGASRRRGVPWRGVLPALRPRAQAAHRRGAPRQGAAERRAARPRDRHVTDLAALASSFVELPSPSRDEGPLADLIESMLAPRPHLEVRRIGRQRRGPHARSGRSRRVDRRRSPRHRPGLETALARVDGRAALRAGRCRHERDPGGDGRRSPRSSRSRRRT